MRASSAATTRSNDCEEITTVRSTATRFLAEVVVALIASLHFTVQTTTMQQALRHSSICE
jgi:hypothetical protein